MQKVIVIVM